MLVLLMACTVDISCFAQKLDPFLTTEQQIAKLENQLYTVKRQRQEFLNTKKRPEKKGEKQANWDRELASYDMSITDIENTLRYLRSLPKNQKIDLNDVVSKANKAALAEYLKNASIPELKNYLKKIQNDAQNGSEDFVDKWKTLYNVVNSRHDENQDILDPVSAVYREMDRVERLLNKYAPSALPADPQNELYTLLRKCQDASDLLSGKVNDFHKVYPIISPAFKEAKKQIDNYLEQLRQPIEEERLKELKAENDELDSILNEMNDLCPTCGQL